MTASPLLAPDPRILVNPLSRSLGHFILCLVACVSVGVAQIPGPIPTPSPRQLAWQSLEYSAFVHFGLNTYTDREWGYGDESPAIFDPAEFDADRVVALFKAAGMRSVILTAKHHDGFCLWPSAWTEHSVKNSPWKKGSGDVVREYADACRKHGLKFGVYLSPWDRNHKDYGRPEYIIYYRAQLRELLTNYGEISEVWFDGANGGDGFYGGARETRQIDRRTYYDWPTTWELVRTLQPNAVIFSDVGPDVRWVGNESGVAGETNWATYSPVGPNDDAPAPGYTKYQEGVEGHRYGTSWIPAECDVSIRPGWFYHASEDSAVKTPQELMRLYLRSVGRNASLLLNVPLDRRGNVAAPDSIALMGFRALRDSCFASARPASLARGWGEQASWIATFSGSTTFNALELAEDVSKGQCVAAFRIEAWSSDRWVTIASGTTIGRRRIIEVPTTTTDRVRLVIIDQTSTAWLKSVRALTLTHHE